MVHNTQEVGQSMIARLTVTLAGAIFLVNVLDFARVWTCALAIILFSGHGLKLSALRCCKAMKLAWYNTCVRCCQSFVSEPYTIC